MNSTQTNPFLPMPRQRPQTAVGRIDEFLKLNLGDYDAKAINRARRIVFGDAAIDNQPTTYEPQPI